MIARMPNFLESPVKTLTRYFDYQGTATRSEFWLFVLFTWISSFAVSILDAFIPGDVLGSLWNGFLFAPSVTCAIRRMHDIDRRGWFLLIPIFNLIFLLLPSTPNRWQMGNPDDFDWTGKASL